MGAEGDGEQEWVLLASFENRRAAERMVASLGRGFRNRCTAKATRPRW